MSKALRIIFIIFLTLAITTSATAQPADPLESVAGAFDSLGDSIDWWEEPTMSITQFAIWVLIPSVGLFAIFNFVFQKSFEFASENFRNNSGYGNQGLGEMGKSMAKLLALATSIITVVVWGGLLGWAMIIAGLGGIIWFGWAVASGIGGTIGPLPFGAPSFGNSGEQQVPQEMIEEMESLDSENQRLRQEIEQLSQEQEDDEQAVSNRQESPAEAESHIKTELQQLKQLEQQLVQMEDQVETIESQIKNQEQQTEAEEQQEQKLLETLGQQQKKFTSALKQIEAYEEEIIQNEAEIDQIIEQFKNSGQIKTEVIHEDIAYNFRDLEQIEGMLRQLREMGEQEFQELQKALQEERDVLTNLGAQKQEIENLEGEVKQLFQEINIVESLFENEEDVIRLTEKLAQEVKDREDYQSLEEDERVIENLEQNFNTVLNKEREIRQKIEQLEEIEQAEREQHQQIIQELEELRKGFEKTQQMLRKIEELINKFIEEAQYEEMSVEEMEEMVKNDQTAGGGTKKDKVWSNSTSAREYKKKANERGVVDLEKTRKEFEKALAVAKGIKQDLEGSGNTQGVIAIVDEMERELENYLSQLG